MPDTTYRNRRAGQIESATLRVTVLAEGGHIAEILHKPSGVNPLWTPPWPSIEPSTYDRARHPEYGADAESKLLAGIMGHNLCMDIFGGVSEEEAAAGLTVHGEASVAPYQIDCGGDSLVARAEFPQAQLRFERRIRAGEAVVDIAETVENLAATDRPIGWTQHVTLGPPFLEKGATQFRATATRSKVYEAEFGDVFEPGAEFTWPYAPGKGGGTVDLRILTSAPSSAGYTTHLMDPAQERAWFLAWSPAAKLLFGYEWKQADFPWMGIWEENSSRRNPPWNGRTLTRGMEFGVSPMPETRRKMIARGGLFGVAGYRWIPARSRVRVDYRAFLQPAGQMAERPAL